MKRLHFEKPELIKLDTDLAYGNIGGITVGAGWTAASDKTVRFKDSQSLLLTATAANDNSECTIASPTLVSGGDYWQTIWVWVPSIHDNSKLYADWDGAATPILSREIGKSLGDNNHFAREFNLAGTYYLQATNNTIHDIGEQDIGIGFWGRVATDAVAFRSFIVKRSGSDAGYEFRLGTGNVLQLSIEDGAGHGYSVQGTTDIRDNKWHYFTGIIDKSTEANCMVFIDRYDDTASRSGTLGDVGDITNTSILNVGRKPGSAIQLVQIRDVVLAYPVDIMAANEMGAAGEIANLYNNPGDPGQWPNHEDRWLCNDNTNSTVVTGANNNLIASANTDVFAETHWKRYDICFEADQAGIDMNMRITGAGAGANTSTVYVDSAQLRVNMINKPGFEGGANPPAGWTQEGSATVISDTSPHSGTNCLKVTAAAANVGVSQNVTLIDATNYTFAVYAKATSGDTAALVVDKGDGTLETLATTTSTSWTLLQGTFLSTGVNGVIYLRGVANGDIVWFDDASGLKPDIAAASTDSKASSLWPKTNPMYIG